MFKTLILFTQDNKWDGGHDGLWDGKRYFKCPKGHGILMPFSRIIKNPLFLPDSVPMDLNNLSSATATSNTPNLHCSVSDSAANVASTRSCSNESDSKPLSEKIFDKFLELTVADPIDSADGMLY